MESISIKWTNLITLDMSLYDSSFDSWVKKPQTDLHIKVWNESTFDRKTYNTYKPKLQTFLKWKVNCFMVDSFQALNGIWNVFCHRQNYFIFETQTVFISHNINNSSPLSPTKHLRKICNFKIIYHFSTRLQF